MVVATAQAVVAGKKVVQGQADMGRQLQERMHRLEDQLNKLFLEREPLVNGMLTMLIGRQNLFAGGPPGTGKTQLSKTLGQAFDIGSYYYLVGASTEPGHVLGPVDLKAMMEDHEFKLNLSGMMADKPLVILDEGFKGNAPFLNSLLGLMLDHGIQNGREWHEAPLMSVVVCSNELPQSDRLAAFWDRLSLRFWVDDVSWANRQTLMLREAGLEKTPLITEKFSMAELIVMQRAADSLPCTKEAILLANQVCKDLADKQITLSTRKSVQLVRLMRAFAYVNGSPEVTEEHIGILKHALWSEPSQSVDIDEKVDELLEKALAAVTSILDAAKKLVASCQEYPVNTSAARKMHFEGVDGRIVEMIDKLARIERNSPRTRRGTKAAKTLAAVKELRAKHILPVLSQIQLNG